MGTDSRVMAVAGGVLTLVVIGVLAIVGGVAVIVV